MFCLNYYPYKRYLDNVDQLKIFYRAGDSTLEDFLEAYQNKSIVIDITNSFEELDAQLFNELSKKYQNFRLIVDYFNEESFNLVKKYKLPFFFCNYIKTIDELHGLISYHPTDMYITEELGFYLDKVSKILHDNGIKVRVFPNICQSSFSETESIKTFFIRPQDIENYSKYVDIFELISDEARQQVVYKIYKQEKWFGPVSEIIPSFKGTLDSRFILSNFGAVRAKCGKRCFYAPNSCNICERYTELANALSENNLIIKRAKKKEEPPITSTT